ncbi:hypothetical protein AYO38_01140 [bacterium SCGC AG-212-C10]|nr:hypothetical protein AYO38_01140 [bacterium SCGC AG-212-C10]
MSIAIARPRLLVALLVIFALMGGALTVMAINNEDHSSTTDVNFIPIGGIEPSPVAVTSADISELEAIVRTDGRVDRITGGQSLTLQNERAESLTTGAKLVAVDAIWDQPVDSSGPWRELECRRTVAYDLSASWSNLRSVAIYVDLGSRTVVKLVPGVVASELGGKLDRTSIDKGKVPSCPEGTNDD